MKLIVNPHKIDLIKEESVNEKEINISKCTFEFSEEFSDSLVKEAYFTFEGESYKQLIINNECSYPPEVLEKEGTVELGVVAYEVAGSEYIERFNPSPVYFQTVIGSLKDHAENSQEITPSEMEQFEQALEEGLAEVQNVDIDASKTDNTATVSITNRNGETKTVEIYDGEQGEAGLTPNIQVGNTTTLPAGSNATVTQRGTTENPIFDFGIPKGEDGQGGGVTSVNGQTGDVTINVPDMTNYYTKTETYNKTEVDNKVSSVYRYRGTVSTYNDLPSTDLVVGDVYNIETADSEHGIEAGDNVAWTGTVWDKLSGNVDLSGYQPLLVSGTNIKTINNKSALGSGNLDLESDLLLLEYNDNSDDAKARASRIINKFYGKTAIGCVINIRPVLLYCNISQQQSTYYFSFDGILDYSNRRYYKFHVTGTWDNNVYTCSSISYEYEQSADFFAYALSTKNTTSYTPTAGSYKPATAKYAEEKAQEVATQYSTVPTASSSNAGKIIQFTGTTDSTYTNGYFYQCVENDGSYSWQNVNVQPSGSSGVPSIKYYIVNDHLIYNITPGTYSVIASSASIITKTKLPLAEIQEALQLAYTNDKYLILHIFTTSSSSYIDYKFNDKMTLLSTQTKTGYGLGTNSSGNTWLCALNITYDNEFGLFGITCNGVTQYTIGLSNTQTFNPTSSYQPATKKYVDDNLPPIIQYSTMPTPSTNYNGRIVQYTGTTDANYTNGYFYKCEIDNNLYVWNNVNVQASSGGGTPLSCSYIVAEQLSQTSVIIFVNVGTFSMGYSTHTAINSYINTVLNDTNINGKNNVRLTIQFVDAWFSCIDNLDLSSNGNKTPRYKIATEKEILDGTSNITIRRTDGVVNYNSWSNTMFNGLTKRYLTLDNSTAYTPTANSYNPATTKYVDDAITSAITNTLTGSY